MGKTVKIVERKEEETFEYINTTNGEGMRKETMAFTMENGRTKFVKPGKSVFFTQKEIDEHLADEDRRFLDGRIRARDVSEDALKNIKASDTMSEMEIEVLVRDAENSKSLAGKLARVNSIPTLATFKKYVEKYDKPVSILNVVLNRLNKLQAERDEKLKFTPPRIDNRAEELRGLR